MSIHDEKEGLRSKLEQEQKALVRVALFGQPGAGKSSLINKLVGRRVAEVGVETDKTVDARDYQTDGVTFVDLPGYGTTRFPAATYWQQFDIDSFDCLLCVVSGKLQQTDVDFFNRLIEADKACVLVVNKHDELWEEGVSIEELERRKRDDLRRQIPKARDIVFTSCRSGANIDVLQEEIAKHLEGAKRGRWARTAKAYTVKSLNGKRAACERLVTIAAGVSAANGLNPIPGVDIAVDLGVLTTLFSEIRDNYGLTEKRLSALQALPAAKGLADQVLKYATREGLLLLLKQFAGRQTVKEVSKYIPFVGQAVAATLGFTITNMAGNSYLDDCHQLAKQIIENHLEY